MAIKQRKQVTGTTEQINAYAGVEGQLVWDKTKKKWVGMSGTAGTNYPMASERHQHSIANVTDLQKKLDEKASKTELTNGLAGKANASHTHTIANVTGLQDALNGKLATTAKIPYSQITGTPSIPDISGLIPKTGDRGALAGYEKWSGTGATATLSVSSGDTLLMSTGGAAATINVQASAVGQVATKLVWVSLSNKSITINGSVQWFGDNAPTLNKANVVLLFFFHDGYTDCKLIGQWD